MDGFDRKTIANYRMAPRDAFFGNRLPPSDSEAQQRFAATLGFRR
jgi:hypothetical protein